MYHVFSHVVLACLCSYRCAASSVFCMCRVESQLLHLHLQPQQPSVHSAADQLADILNGCRICSTQVTSSLWQLFGSMSVLVLQAMQLHEAMF